MTSRILQGSVFDVLPTLDAESVQMCVTSPPYWGLRDYGVDGQLGLEPTPEEYVTRMVEVFREVGRVLKDDGTLWLNLGDSYARKPLQARRWPAADPSSGRLVRAPAGPAPCGKTKGVSRASEIGLKEKDLVGIPWRIAFALQSDGWYLRQDIIWHKPNPMPESVTDRCTKAHEYMFLISKSARYWFDAEAIKEPLSPRTLTVNTTSTKGSGTESFGEKLGKWMAENGGRYHPEKANKRSVWTVPSEPVSDAHFACYPQKLIEPCILAGSRPGDVVLDPFFGSGTTGQVCERLGRQWLGIELNPEYAAMAARRTAQRGFCFG